MLEAVTRVAQERPEVAGPADSASVLAGEVRERLAALARELAEL